mmetsp:Transcript_16898/g.41515  ORF Transcript_16898/g.41515 Transcript_16898/m.41515 type:complete len:226 (+) Transcript_16898:685-1362(+)
MRVPLGLACLHHLLPGPNLGGGREQLPALGVVKHGVNAVLRPVLVLVHHGLYAPVGAQVPDLDGLVCRQRDDLVEVVVYAHVADAGCVPHQRANLVPRAAVPQHDVALHAPRDHHAVRVAPVERVHTFRVQVHRVPELELVFVRVHDLERSVHGAGHHGVELGDVHQLGDPVLVLVVHRDVVLLVHGAPIPVHVVLALEHAHGALGVAEHQVVLLGDDGVGHALR